MPASPARGPHRESTLRRGVRSPARHSAHWMLSEVVAQPITMGSVGIGIDRLIVLRTEIRGVLASPFTKPGSKS